jgi:hypothetical protein
MVKLTWYLCKYQVKEMYLKIFIWRTNRMKNFDKLCLNEYNEFRDEDALGDEDELADEDELC